MRLKELLHSKAILQREVDSRRLELEMTLAPVLEQIIAADKEIRESLATNLEAIRKLQSKEFGAVSITKDGYKITHTVPKKIRWDQDKLFGVYQKITSVGDDPFQWMKAEWKVGEKEYNSYPKDIQSVFAPARTVTPGEPKLEFKELEVADA